MLNGLLVVYKPTGLTSYDIVRRLKKLVGKNERIGHCGTLDPAAEGILLILFGQANRRQSEFMNMVKTYRTTIYLGQQTDTGDSRGRLVKEAPVPDLSVKDVEAVLKKFVGEISQVPPMYSAIHCGGRRLYELARRGITVKRKTRQVKIYSLELLKMELPRLFLRVRCSRGTYIRTLAEDIAGELGTVGMVAELAREKVGDFDETLALKYSEIENISGNDLKQKILSDYA